MKHKKLECTAECCDPYCNTCNLFTCSVCNCSEGELPSDCPGTIVSYVVREDILKGRTNFINGEWVKR